MGVYMKRLVFMCVLTLTLCLGAVSHAAGVVTLGTQHATSPWLKDIVADFTEATGIQVELLDIGWGVDELYVMYAAGAMPDVFTHGTASLGALADQGLMDPLDAIVETWDFMDDVIPVVYDLTMYDDKLMGIPYNGIRIDNLIYHTLMFEEAGLSADIPPETWDDLVAYGRRLVRRDADGRMTRSGLNISTSGTTPSKWFRLLTVQSGLDPFGDELDTVSLVDDRIVAAVTFYADLFHTHGLTEPGFSGTFGAGTTAMNWDRVRPYEELLGPDAQNIRVATFPYNKVPVTNFIGDYISLASASNNKEEALQLMAFILSPEQHERAVVQVNNVPIYMDGLNWDVVKRTSVYTEAIVNMMNSGHVSSSHKEFFALRDLHTDIMRAVLDPTAAPGVVLERENNRFLSILGRH